MAILVFGKTGQVARELQNIGEVLALGRKDADLSDPATCSAIIESKAPEAVINAAAYTAVDTAEAEEEQAMLVNCDAVREMAVSCKKADIPFVHISTDYVFDGSGVKPWQPLDLTEPTSAYGRTKLAGEEAVRATGGSFAIMRTSWVFSSHGNNFLKTLLKMSKTRDELRVVDDQIGGPTPASAIAQVCLDIVSQLKKDPTKAGTYHFSGAPDVSWAGFARAIFDAASIDATVHGIPTREYPTPATRPLNSRLDCRSMQDTFGIARPNWRSAIPAILRDLEKQK